MGLVHLESRTEFLLRQPGGTPHRPQMLTQYLIAAMVNGQRHASMLTATLKKASLTYILL